MSDNYRAGVWLLCDMCLHISALAMVKALGADYPAVQLVFLRAVTGLAVLLPWILSTHQNFVDIKNWRLHIARVFCSAVALSCGYYAVSRVPLALFTTINYLRPAILMLLAVVVLGEKINQWRWMAVALGFIGVIVAVFPIEYTASTGLLALFFAVLAGSIATILLRQLKGHSEIVMMVFYTAGIAFIAAPLTLVQWVPMSIEDTSIIIIIGVLAQVAQYCFLRAHWLGEAGFLGPLGYTSLFMSAVAGYVFFDEIPTISLVIGALIVLGSAVLLGRRSGSAIR